MSESTAKTVVILAPKAKVSKDTLDALDAAGFVVVRCLPDEFKIVSSSLRELDDPAILAVALNTIATYSTTADNGNALRNKFARALATEIGLGDMVKLK